MSLARLPRRVLNALHRRAEPLLAPLAQAEAGWAFARDPAGWRARADAAIGRGVDWFAPQPDLTMSALYVLWRAWQAGADPRLGFIAQKIAQYRATIRDPALRLFDPAYDPEAPEAAHLPDIMAVRPYQPVELMMIEAVWADVRHPGPEFPARLAGIADGAGYGTTHIGVAGEILLRNGSFPEAAVRPMLDAIIAPMARANRRTPYAGDIFAERAVLLQWLGRPDLVTPAHAVMLIRRQNPDGGWMARGVAPEGQSNQHTTCLAMAALAWFRMAERRG